MKSPFKELFNKISDGFAWANCFNGPAIKQGIVYFKGIQLTIEEARTKFVLFLWGWKRHVSRAILALVVLFLLQFTFVYFGSPASFLFTTISILTIALLGWLFFLVTPIFLIFRNLKRHWPEFETMSNDLHDYYIIFIKTVTLVVIVFLLAAILPFWWRTYPLIGFVLLLSMMVPLISKGRIKLNSALIIVIASLLFFQWTFPKTVTNWGEVISRATEKIISPPRKEITSEYASLVWFGSGEQGSCLIWYSGDEITGYRLWSNPGFDPDTNQEFHQVCSTELKDSIIRNLELSELKQAAIEQRSIQDRQEKERASQLKAEADSYKRLRSELIDTSIPPNDPRRTEVALLLWGVEESSINSIQSALDTNQATFSIQQRLFRKAFVTEGYADLLLKEQSDISKILALEEFIDFVCLGSLKFTVTEDAQAQGLVTAKGLLTLKIYSTSKHRIVSIRTIDGLGGGFSSETALNAMLKELNSSFGHYLNGLEFDK